MTIISLISLVFLALVFPLGQLAKIRTELLPPGINLYFNDLFVFSAILCGLPIIRRQMIKNRHKALYFFLLFGWSIVVFFLKSQTYSMIETFVAGAYLVRWIVYSLLFFLIGGFVAAGIISARQVKKTLLADGLIAAFLGIVQYLILPDLRGLAGFGWDPHYLRLAGSFLDPGFAGLILVLSMILLFEIIEKKARFTSIFCLFFTVLGLTYSRSAFLALVAAAYVYFLRTKKHFFLILALSTVFLALILPGGTGEGVKLERSSTVKFRIANWHQSLAITGREPILGTGFNFLRYYRRNHQLLGADWETNHAGAGADASLLFVSATLGLPGLVFYVNWWRILLERFTIKKNKTLLAVMTALFVHSLFLNSQFYPWVLAYVMVLLGTETEARSDRR